MHSDNIIQDLFDAAREEQPVRDFPSVEGYVTSKLASTKSSLIVKWLTQYKMNILITSAGLLLTASIYLTERSGLFTDQSPDPSREVLIEIPEMEQAPFDSLADSASSQSTVQKRAVPAEPTKEVQEETVTLPSTMLEAVEVNRVPSRTKPKTSAEQQPVKPIRSTSNKSDQQPKEKRFDDSYHIVLERNGGTTSATAFRTYVEKYLTRLNADVSTSTSSGKVKRFLFKLSNGVGGTLKMRSEGFDRFELRWKLDENGQPYDMWYRFDLKKEEKLKFGMKTRGNVKIKHQHY